MRFRRFEVVRLVHGFPQHAITPGTLAVVTGVPDADPSFASPVAYELEIHRPGKPLYRASATEDAITPLLTPGRRRLWIMPGYQCHSFWATDGTTSGVHDNVSAASLELSPSLVAEVAAWEAAYEAAYEATYEATYRTAYGGGARADASDRAESSRAGFSSAAAEEAFRSAGQAIANRVAAELGSGWSVVYRYGESDEPDPRQAPYFLAGP